MMWYLDFVGKIGLTSLVRSGAPTAPRANTQLVTNVRSYPQIFAGLAESDSDPSWADGF